MILDLFDFGEVNRKYGIPVGDSLMRMLASRLSQALRRNDCIARMDSDEFIFLLEDIINLDSAHVVARKILQTLDEPFEIERHNIIIKGSLGISLYPENSLEAQSLVKKAWIAMEKSAECGEPYEFYPVQQAEGIVSGSPN
jgi:diguanylate cyclase (GGDEF)-like protein